MPDIDFMTAFYITMGIIALGSVLLWGWAMLSIREEKRQRRIKEKKADQAIQEFFEQGD